MPAAAGVGPYDGSAQRPDARRLVFASMGTVVTLLSTTPLSDTTAASVAAARETSVVMAAAMGGLFLHEEVGPRRLLGAATVVVGIAALALG